MKRLNTVEMIRCGDGDSAGSSASFGRSRLCADPGRGQDPAAKGMAKNRERFACNAGEWGRNWPRANNTGILTKFTPTLDADILNEPAAIAIEDLVRERFEERGYILPRIGKAPKRAIPFRTADPFPKITVNLIAANGSTGEKIEFMCDGQQIVAAGIHPDTGKPMPGRSAIRPTSRTMICPISAKRRRRSWLTISSSCCAVISAIPARRGAARKGNGAQPEIRRKIGSSWSTIFVPAMSCTPIPAIWPPRWCAAAWTAAPSSISCAG